MFFEPLNKHVPDNCRLHKGVFSSFKIKVYPAGLILSGWIKFILPGKIYPTYQIDFYTALGSMYPFIRFRKHVVSRFYPAG